MSLVKCFYSFSIRLSAVLGTPRFQNDGALGFEISTSNPKYDRIFGSFSYAIGESSRLACQLGWPQVVIGLEAGLEWQGWQQFQLYSTFSSPWTPVKNINMLVKIDTTQVRERDFLMILFYFVRPSFSQACLVNIHLNALHT